MFRRLFEFTTFIASLCYMSGIDVQPWQAVPGLGLMILFVVELETLEDDEQEDECEEW